MNFRNLSSIALLLLLPSCGERKIPLLSPADSVLRVTSTIQYPDLQRPWMKKQPFTREGLGTVIEGGGLLVTADLVAHSTYIELEKPERGIKGTARVEAIDEECNLALLKPLDAGMFADTRPLSLDTSVRAGAKLDILQLEPNGASALSPATVTTVAVMPYPGDGMPFLLYRASASIPQREGSFVIPALHDSKLAGLVMRYDTRTQAVDIIPSPLIARFLKECRKPGYSGLGRAGLTWEEVRGNNLREWLGAGTDRAGVYITSIEPGGPADKAGLRKGDLIVRAGGNPIDGEGNYTDPVLGKVNFSNLATLASSPGDKGEIVYFRSTGEGTGTLGTATITLGGRNPSSEISPSRINGEKVPHVFLGGLLFQELSRPYLREWGSDWQREAPQNLVYLDAFQNEFPSTQGHFVILSAVLPTPQTIGLQDLANRVVVSINGQPIHSLSDVREAALHPEHGFQKILLEGSGGPVFLEASSLAEEEDAVRKRYGIPPPPNQ